MMRRILIVALALCGASLGSTAQAQQPNILFIMVDDLGYADLGVTGSRHIRTPNIDQLAGEGMRLTNGYANGPICSPTRVALATGKYQGRSPIGLAEPFGPSSAAESLPKGEPTIATRMRDLGYFTALIGKWHLGHVPENGPTRFGWDHFFGTLAGISDYFIHRAVLTRQVPGDGLWLNEESVEREGYLTNLYADEAIRLIDESDADRPFYISVHFNAPHWPWEGPFDRAVADSLTDLNHVDGGSLETYAEMVESIDQNVGRMLLALDAKGLADNTIVVFTSDNGAERFSDTWPFVGVKGELLEGGIRVPIIVRWEGRTPTQTVSDQLMISMDFLPTFVAAGGGEVSPGETDGVNLLPVLVGESEPVDRTLYWRYKANDQAAVRQGKWKYLRIGGQEHLFDLEADARERAELRDKYPEKFEELRQLHEAWANEMLPYPEDSFSENVQDRYSDRYPHVPSE